MLWVRVHGQGAHQQAIVVHVSHVGAVEVTLHQRTTPSSPKIDNSHFPPQAAGALGRQPMARNGAEANWSVSQSGPYAYENLGDVATASGVEGRQRWSPRPRTPRPWT